MSKKKEEVKTNVVRLLEANDIPCTPYVLPLGKDVVPDGVTAARLMDKPPEQVFKTLVAEGPKGEHFVYVIPVAETLDLKKAAKAAGVKSIAMLPQKKLLPLTGYVHGGCSPVGMKKPFPTYIDETALITDAFFCSAGRRGAQMGVDPPVLAEYIGAAFADLTEE